MRTELLLTREVITVPPLVWPSREIGACVEFHGIVREMEGEAALTGLEYEAYETMAYTELERIFAALAQVHACAAVVFIHRLGWVPVGEISVYVRVLAKHRGPALRMCEEAIEALKRDVPIWKGVVG